MTGQETNFADIKARVRQAKTEVSNDPKTKLELINEVYSVLGIDGVVWFGIADLGPTWKIPDNFIEESVDPQTAISEYLNAGYDAAANLVSFLAIRGSCIEGSQNMRIYKELSEKKEELDDRLKATSS